MVEIDSLFYSSTLNLFPSPKWEREANRSALRAHPFTLGRRELIRTTYK